MELKSIQNRYEAVLERINQAAVRCSRPLEGIRLVVVTKAHPVAVVQAVCAAGARDLGENYAEEAVDKMAAIEAGLGVSWHMIGHVQSRKVALVARHFDYLHSLDSLKLALRLEKKLAAIGRDLPVLLEYNVGGEATKYGWPAWQPDQWPQLLPEIGQILNLPHLIVRGVMTVAPYHPEPAQARIYYRRLRELRDFLAGTFTNVAWHEMSMGMSHDFEIAIEEGATFVRIGEAILGPRPPRS